MTYAKGSSKIEEPRTCQFEFVAGGDYVISSDVEKDRGDCDVEVLPVAEVCGALWTIEVTDQRSGAKQTCR